MSFSGDIKTIRVADAETPTDSVPARIRAVSIFSNGQGTTRFTITDNGTTVFDVDVASGAYQYFDLPDLGIPCRNDLTISTADNLAEATIFYTGEVDLTAYTGESEGSLRPAINLGLETGTLTPVTGSVTPTYTRATERVMPDYQGILRTVPSGAFTPGGFRVVENLMNLVSGANSEDMTSTGFSTTSGVTVDSATQVTYDGTGGFQSVKFATGFAPANTSLEYIFHVKIRVVSGSPSGSDVLIEIGNGADVSKSVGDDISGTEAWVSYGPDNHDGAGNFELRVLFANTACTLEVTEWMLEDVTGQVNQAPSEYVSVVLTSLPGLRAALSLSPARAIGVAVEAVASSMRTTSQATEPLPLRYLGLPFESSGLITRDTPSDSPEEVLFSQVRPAITRIFFSALGR